MPEGHIRNRSRCVVTFLVVTLIGCGARAFPDGGEEGPPEGGNGVRGQGSGSPSGAAGTRATQDPGPAPPVGYQPTPLPACEPGFREGSGDSRECNFVYDRLCYEDENVACACARCPSQGCLFRGFLNPDGPQNVSCR
jgi:hypothetical protein